MSKIHLALMGVGLALTAGCKTMESAPSLADVEVAERARFVAFTSGDVAAIRPLLADDLVYCHSTARCQNKEALLASLASKEYVYRSAEVLELKPRAVGGAVVINGKVQLGVDSAGKAQQIAVIYTDVYVKRDGRWLMTAWQSTRIP